MVCFAIYYSCSAWQNSIILHFALYILRYFFGLRLIIDGLLYFVLVRVFTPMACLPQGVVGYFKPIGLWPSPPPCGWSIGFIALPRTVGRIPMWRLRPALPIL